MLEEWLNYLAVLSIENYITKSLSYEEATKEYAAQTKNVAKKYYGCVSGIWLVKILLFFWIFLCF
jgi:hypothetical protein